MAPKPKASKAPTTLQRLNEKKAYFKKHGKQMPRKNAKPGKNDMAQEQEDGEQDDTSVGEAAPKTADAGTPSTSSTPSKPSESQPKSKNNKSTAKAKAATKAPSIAPPVKADKGKGKERLNQADEEGEENDEDDEEGAEDNVEKKKDEDEKEETEEQAARRLEKYASKHSGYYRKFKKSLVAFRQDFEYYTKEQKNNKIPADAKSKLSRVSRGPSPMQYMAWMQTRASKNDVITRDGVFKKDFALWEQTFPERVLACREAAFEAEDTNGTFFNIVKNDQWTARRLQYVVSFPEHEFDRPKLKSSEVQPRQRRKALHSLEGEDAQAANAAKIKQSFNLDARGKSLWTLPISELTAADAHIIADPRQINMLDDPATIQKLSENLTQVLRDLKDREALIKRKIEDTESKEERSSKKRKMEEPADKDAASEQPEASSSKKAPKRTKNSKTPSSKSAPEQTDINNLKQSASTGSGSKPKDKLKPKAKAAPDALDTPTLDDEDEVVLVARQLAEIEDAVKQEAELVGEVQK